MNTSVPATASGAALATADLEGLKDAVKVADTDRAPIVGGDPFLKLTKDGTWEYGPENIEVQPGSLWAIDPTSFLRGYTCWTDYPKELRRKNDKMGEIMVPLGAKRPDEKTLPEHIDRDSGTKWPWTPALGVVMVCLTGEDKGQRVLYTTNSKSGTRLLDKYFEKMKVNLAENRPVAVIELKHDSYQDKTWGKTIIPFFEYAEWRALEDATPIEQAEQEPEPAVEDQRKPVGRSRRAPVENDDQEQTTGGDQVAEDEAPVATTGRRRPATGDDGGEAPKPTRSRRRPAA